MTEDSGELTEFEKLVNIKVAELMDKHYSDLDFYSELPIRMDSIWAIEGIPGLGPFSKDLYSGPNWAEDFFRDHPKFRKIRDDSEIKAVREKDQEWQKKLAAAHDNNARYGCFIATAAYGTPFAEEINVLRNWRDESLETTYSGKLFIKTYYNLSQPVADNIRNSSVKKKFVRFFLNPVVKVLSGSYGKKLKN